MHLSSSAMRSSIHVAAPGSLVLEAYSHMGHSRLAFFPHEHFGRVVG